MLRQLNASSSLVSLKDAVTALSQHKSKAGSSHGMSGNGLSLSLVVHPVKRLDSFMSFVCNHSFLVYSLGCIMNKWRNNWSWTNIWKCWEIFTYWMQWIVVYPMIENEYTEMLTDVGSKGLDLVGIMKYLKWIWKWRSKFGRFSFITIRKL